MELVHQTDFLKKPSYMAINKALYGKQPGILVLLLFSLLLQKSIFLSIFCVIAVTRELVLVCLL
jgi:hypothetical protein